MFIMYCKYSTGCSNLAFTNGKEKPGIIMCVLQLSSPCNYRAAPGLNSDKGGPLNQHRLKHSPEAKQIHTNNSEERVKGGQREETVCAYHLILSVRVGDRS